MTLREHGFVHKMVIQRWFGPAVVVAGYIPSSRSLTSVRIPLFPKEWLTCNTLAAPLLLAISPANRVHISIVRTKSAVSPVAGPTKTAHISHSHAGLS